MVKKIKIQNKTLHSLAISLFEDEGIDNIISITSGSKETTNSAQLCFHKLSPVVSVTFFDKEGYFICRFCYIPDKKGSHVINNHTLPRWISHFISAQTLPGRCQAIIWNNAGWLLIGPNWIKIQQFSLKKIHFKMSSGKCRSSCPGLNVFTVWN